MADATRAVNLQSCASDRPTGDKLPARVDISPPPLRRQRSGPERTVNLRHFQSQRTMSQMDRLTIRRDPDVLYSHQAGVAFFRVGSVTKNIGLKSPIPQDHKTELSAESV
ncbi:hypothetical protein SNOG_05292 [Parastagonospora nodorum SN15]|uniref:Uncharacterized protein n=1 Tax=Phaeosphaeria nodorum (strain SN15 / ATCC MYA-4574 / FGSC 10173) TaxID=321614 RepID=Q0USH2_PHANO|nr:hypothetical protein SNOG_05292 [Parastagonospora nodorum SN15]EAT87683.1 hypothetical protein SNOG_05292 [Parastagonospora nodorum SN15]